MVFGRGPTSPWLTARYIFELESGLLTSLEEILPPAKPETPHFDPNSLSADHGQFVGSFVGFHGVESMVNGLVLSING